jgi:predicted GIY-YIG superfamily endonuclease
LIQKYSYKIRTTIGEYLAHPAEQYNGAGVYIIASYPALETIYVGISDHVGDRLIQHAMLEVQAIDKFLTTNWVMACSWRLDILVIPEDCNTYALQRAWMELAERALINHLNPIYNVSNSPRSEIIENKKERQNG